MSFKIDRENNRYKISIGTGETYRANNLQEVVYALQHYFQESIPMYPFEYHRHAEQNKIDNRCPLCTK